MELNLQLRITYLQDVLGNTYVGFKLEPYQIEEVLQKWYESFSSLLGADLKTMFDNREKRDGNHYHSTLFPVAEYQKESLRSSIQEYIGQEYTLKLAGVGRAIDEKKGLEAQFVVMSCQKLEDVRSSLGLEKRDLHITLGFEKKDVFSKPKDSTSIYINF